MVESDEVEGRPAGKVSVQLMQRMAARVKLVDVRFQI